MKIAVIHCHTANRGDEAAVHALIDELMYIYPQCEITLFLRGKTVYPNLPEVVQVVQQYVPIGKKRYIEYQIMKATKGALTLTNEGREFRNLIAKSDLVLHAPGGPSIGDTYYNGEVQYLRIYDLLIAMEKPYMFYAPSMGPFDRNERNAWRKKILNNAQAIVLRDPISAEYVRNLLPNKKIYQTLDSAFQHDIDIVANKKKLDDYRELSDFISRHDKCIGITITDLRWHPLYMKNPIIIKKIQDSFMCYLEELVEDGYGIIFIPQLYGNGNDYTLMRNYMLDNDNYFEMPDNEDKYDTYFQQYVISKIYAVIGMRYHSNIFSAKMSTPFISISYEQKMEGFMKKMNLYQYCIKLDELSVHSLREKFTLLCQNYDNYKNYLIEKHNEMKADAYKTTEILNEILVRIMKEENK
jgi:colanic acid/amylovoran biosynthesis protein